MLRATQLLNELPLERQIVATSRMAAMQYLAAWLRARWDVPLASGTYSLALYFLDTSALYS